MPSHHTMQQSFACFKERKFDYHRTLTAKSLDKCQNGQDLLELLVGPIKRCRQQNEWPFLPCSKPEYLTFIYAVCPTILWQCPIKVVQEMCQRRLHSCQSKCKTRTPSSSTSKRKQPEVLILDLYVLKKSSWMIEVLMLSCH